MSEYASPFEIIQLFSFTNRGICWSVTRVKVFKRPSLHSALPISALGRGWKARPFRDFVSSLFESRFEARKSGNEAIAYVSKILITVDFAFTLKARTIQIETDHWIRHSEWIFGDMLSENNYIVAYHSNTETGSARIMDIKDLSCLENIGKQIIKSLIQLLTENLIINDRRKERYKEIQSHLDAKKNTDKRMHCTLNPLQRYRLVLLQTERY